jgi:hypothetical protein
MKAKAWKCSDSMASAEFYVCFEAAVEGPF